MERKRRKILFITHSSVLAGGAEDEFERLLIYFSKKNDRFELHGLFPFGPRSGSYGQYCSKWSLYKWGFLPVIYEGLWSYIKYVLKFLIQAVQIIHFSFGEKYDLVVVNVVVLLWPALVMSVIMKKKVVIFIREDIYPVNLRHLVYKILSFSCAFFIPNSRTKENNFVSVTNNKKVIHIYPGIEDELINCKNRLQNVIGIERFSFISDKSRFKFLNTAGVFKKKNQYLILEALNDLKGIINIKMPYMIFVGAYDSSSEYMKLLNLYIANNGLNEYCLFLGSLERSVLYELYQYVNASIISSFSEGMPIVLVESFRFGKPVISTKVGGIPEIINNMENGILVEHDEKDLAKAMLTLMNDSKLCVKLSNSAYNTYLEKFNLEKALKRTEDIFNYLMDEK